MAPHRELMPIQSPAPILGASAQNRPLHVFISYSRADVEFANRLVRALEARGLRVFIDRHDLPILEDWQRELLGLIRAADAVVFIVSERSIVSPMCAWEVAEVTKLGKRLAPVILRQASADRIQPEISKFEFVYFDPPNDFETQANLLTEALKTDGPWVKEHTRLGELARRWNERGRSRALTLRGGELEEAEHWLASRPQDAPPTDLHRMFIITSRRAAARRRRAALIGSLSVAFVAILLAGLAYFQRETALRNEREAIVQRDRALVVQSRFLADAARQQIAQGDGATAIALALEALPDTAIARERPYLSEAEASLYEGIINLTEIAVLAHDTTLGAMSWTGPSGAGQDIRTNEDMIQYARDRLLLGEHMFAPMGGVKAMFVQDGSTILTWGNDAARVWGSDNGRRLAKLAPPELGVPAAAISPDGSWVLTAYSDNTIHVWRSGDWSEAAILRGHIGGLINVSFSPDGSRVVTGSWDQTARVWDVSTWHQVLELRGHKGGVNIAMFSGDGSRILTGSDDKTVRVWEAKTGQQLAVLSGHTEALLSVDLSPDGTRIATAANDETARLWDAITGKQLAYLARADAVRAAFSPDGTRAAIALRNGLASIVELGAPNEAIVLRGHERAVLSAAFSPNGAEILTTSNDGTARLWDTLSGREIRVFAGHLRGVFGAVFSPDGRRAVTMSFDGTARVWETNRRMRVPPSKPVLDPEGVATTPDGGRVLKISQDHSVRILDERTSAALAVLKGHKGTVFSAAFSADGALVVTASYDATARIWDSRSGREIATLSGHQAGVLTAAFSPNGKRVATGSSDRTARIWDTGTNTTIANIKIPEYEVHRVQFSPDGTQLLTMPLNGDGHLWPVFQNTQSLVDQAKILLPRCLTGRQRQMFFLDLRPPSWCVADGNQLQQGASTKGGKWPYQIARNSE
jgi:WD40 repeat protein